MTPPSWLPTYDPEVVNSFWRAHCRREPCNRGHRTFINGYHVPATGGNTLARFLVKRKGPVRERTLERYLHEFGFTLTDFEDWARDNYDGWSGRWIQRWEKEVA
jgi:hypothetical protein